MIDQTNLFFLNATEIDTKKKQTETDSTSNGIFQIMSPLFNKRLISRKSFYLLHS